MVYNSKDDRYCLIKQSAFLWLGYLVFENHTNFHQRVLIHLNPDTVTVMLTVWRNSENFVATHEILKCDEIIS